MKPICLGKCLQTPLIIGITAYIQYHAHYQRKKQKWAMITDEARKIVGKKIALYEKYVLQDNDIAGMFLFQFVHCMYSKISTALERIVYRYISAVFFCISVAFIWQIC